MSAMLLVSLRLPGLVGSWTTQPREAAAWLRHTFCFSACSRRAAAFLPAGRPTTRVDNSSSELGSSSTSQRLSIGEESELLFPFRFQVPDVGNLSTRLSLP